MVNNLSAVLAARVAGKVCMQDLNAIARPLALPTPALAERPSCRSNASGWTTAEWAILDTSAVFKPYAQVTDYGAYSEASQRAVFNKSASLCGSVKLFVNSGQDDSAADTSNEAFNNAAKSLGKRLDAVAVSVVMAAVPRGGGPGHRACGGRYRPDHPDGCEGQWAARDRCGRSGADAIGAAARRATVRRPGRARPGERRSADRDHFQHDGAGGAGRLAVRGELATPRRDHPDSR